METGLASGPSSAPALLPSGVVPTPSEPWRQINFAGWLTCYVMFRALIYLFVCLFINFWLHWVFVATRGLSLVGATLRCGARASHCSGFSCCGARALGVQASVVVALRLSSCGSRA